VEAATLAAADALPPPDGEAAAPPLPPLPAASPVERLSLEASPEFLQIPLELQGFCPVALADAAFAAAALPLPGATGAASLPAPRARAVLVQGDPSLGVARFHGRFLVAAGERSMRALQTAPQRFLDAVRGAAALSPGLVHLLELYDSFPLAVLPLVVHGAGAVAADDVHAAAAGRPLHELLAKMQAEHVSGGASASAPAAASAGAGAPTTREVGVETPVHFVESHIVRDYTWNEWELRRRVLRMANLRKAATKSAQTDASHFKRDSAVQVWLPRDGAVQTGIDRGTHPEKTVRYLAGLRGAAPVVRPPAPSASADDAAKVRAANTEATRTRATMVTFTYDLTTLHK
jgi:hypothetical protein